MAGLNIPIRDIPGAIADPVSSDLLAMDNGTQMRKTTVKKVVDAGAPVVSQAGAEAGSDNDARMTALRTKQSIASEVGVSVASKAQGDLASSSVQSVNGKTGSAITLMKADVGLPNVDNTSDANKPVSNATQNALNLKANTADLGSLASKSTVNNTDWLGLDLAVENGGTGASTADVARTNLGAASTAQAVPPGGSTGQVLAKTSNADNAVGWVAAGAGDMLKSTYDPSNVNSNAFDLSNHTGQVPVGSIPFASQAQAEAIGTPNSTLSVNLLRVLQQGQSRGYFSLKDFATTVIDNGTNSAVSAFQGAVNSGEDVKIPKSSGSYLLDGDVLINNPLKLKGSGGASKIKRVSNVGRFMLRSNYITLGDFIEDGSAMTGAAALFHFDTQVTPTPRYIQHTLIENVVSISSGGLIDDNNVKGAGNSLPVIWFLRVSNVIGLGVRSRGIRLRDGFAFLRFRDVAAGLGPQFGGVSLPAYEFRNFEGLFLERVEMTGLAGYTDLGYVPDGNQRGFLITDGAALHLDGTFADNCKGNSYFLQNISNVEGKEAKASISWDTGFNLQNVKRMNVSKITSVGRRNLTDDWATNPNSSGLGFNTDENCELIQLGQVFTSNWGSHGFRTTAKEMNMGRLTSVDNGGFGYVPEGSTGSSLLSGAVFRRNTLGNYASGGTSVNQMASIQKADKTFVATITANGTG